jgi:hypothetical protein
LLNYNNDIINTEITKLVVDLNPAPTNTDDIGHLINLEILLNRIIKCDAVSAELICYACIKTYPAQSEILVTSDSMGFFVQRIIDIRTPEDGKLAFAGIHAANPDHGIQLKRTSYYGCFEENTENPLRGLPITDTVYYLIADDTLTLNII